MRPDDLFGLLLLLIGGAVIGGVLVVRHKGQVLRHKERLAALEKGHAIPPLPETDHYRQYYLKGLLWLAVGIGISTVFAGLSATYKTTPNPEYRLTRAQELRKQGVPEEDIERFLREASQAREVIAVGNVMLGAIPMFVGVAYLIFYRSERRRLGDGKDGGGTDSAALRHTVS